MSKSTSARGMRVPPLFGGNLSYRPAMGSKFYAVIMSRCVTSFRHPGSLGTWSDRARELFSRGRRVLIRFPGKKLICTDLVSPAVCWKIGENRFKNKGLIGTPSTALRAGYKLCLREVQTNSRVFQQTARLNCVKAGRTSGSALPPSGMYAPYYLLKRVPTQSTSELKRF
jgi:hypothetical protein